MSIQSDTPTHRSEDVSPRSELCSEDRWPNDLSPRSEKYLKSDESSPRSNDSSVGHDGEFNTYVPPVVCKCVKATYYPTEVYFEIPDGIDLQNKAQVTNYYVHKNVLHFALVNGDVHWVNGMIYESNLKTPAVLVIVDRARHPFRKPVTTMRAQQRRKMVREQMAKAHEESQWSSDSEHRDLVNGITEAVVSSSSDSEDYRVTTKAKPSGSESTESTKKAQARRQIPIESSSSSSSSSSSEPPIDDDERRAKQKAFDQKCSISFLDV